MEFKKDYSYLYLTKNEYTEPFINEVVKCICFYGTDKFNEEYTEIKEWLEENFIMYQYKNNGIEYGDHELFYWSNSYNGNKNYFTIGLNYKKLSIERANTIVNEITDYLSNKYPQLDERYTLQLTNILNENKWNDYVNNTNFDLKNFPFETFHHVLKTFKLNEEDEKITELENQLIEEYSGKKIEVNGEQGKIKLLPDGINYGFFKTRVRKYYTPFNFKSIKYLKLVK